MPVYRTPDGEIVEEKTQLVGGLRPKSGSPPPAASSPEPEEDERTQLVGRPGGKTAGAATGSARQVPTTGWLVVIDGPGRGNALPLGNGKNDIGRGDDSRVAVSFGDREISRSSHAVLTYDDRGRKFYLADGGSGGDNLTYLDDAPLLGPTELKPMVEIAMGGTRFRFVPFCGPDFDWTADGSASKD